MRYKVYISETLQASQVAQNLPANAGDDGVTVPGLGSSPGGGNGDTLQYSCLGKRQRPDRL